MSRLTLRALLAAAIAILATCSLGAEELRTPAERGCPIEFESRAVWQSDLKRPDLIGKVFWMEKLSSRAEKHEGKMYYLSSVQITDGLEHFVVSRMVAKTLRTGEALETDARS
jgi:hypothetical protein